MCQCKHIIKGLHLFGSRLESNGSRKQTMAIGNRLCGSILSYWVAPPSWNIYFKLFYLIYYYRVHIYLSLVELFGILDFLYKCNIIKTTPMIKNSILNLIGTIFPVSFNEVTYFPGGVSHESNFSMCGNVSTCPKTNSTNEIITLIIPKIKISIFKHLHNNYIIIIPY